MRLDKEEIDAVSDLRYSWRKTLQVPMPRGRVRLRVGVRVS